MGFTCFSSTFNKRQSDLDVGNLETKSTFWMLCHAPGTIPAQFLQRGGTHNPASHCKLRISVFWHLSSSSFIISIIASIDFLKYSFLLSLFCWIRQDSLSSHRCLQAQKQSLGGHGPVAQSLVVLFWIALHAGKWEHPTWCIGDAPISHWVITTCLSHSDPHSFPASNISSRTDLVAT